jgi:hypothetical protein
MVKTILYVRVQTHTKAESGGHLFRTRGSQGKIKADDSHFRFDYCPTEARYAGQQQKGFAQIKRLFMHTAYPGGPSMMMVEGDWFQVIGTCPVAGTTLVKKDSRHPFNSSSRFVFLNNCYNKPVAVWPHDPFDDLPHTDSHKDCFDIIDRNQDEIYD